MNDELFMNLVVVVGGALITVLIGIIAYFLSRLVDQLDTTTENVNELSKSFSSIATSFENFQTVHDKNASDIKDLRADMDVVKGFLQL